MPKSLGATLSFLRGLRGHNDREWFDRNREAYDRARAAFLDAVAELIAGIGRFDDLGEVAPEDCMFRIYRDVRFSRDKSPYKCNMGALMGRGGRKSGSRGYYFHVEPSGRSFLAGGLYEPSPAELGALRAAIAEDSSPLRRILAAPGFSSRFGGLAGDSLKTAPQGYAKDHPDIDLLRHKQFIAQRPLSDEDLLSEGLVAEALAAFKAMKPLLAYLGAASGARG